MLRIMKYQIPADGFVSLPVGARIMKLDIQNEQPSLWVSIHPDELQLRRCLFEKLRTGEPVPEEWHYLNTVFDGPLAYHWFMVPQ